MNPRSAAAIPVLLASVSCGGFKYYLSVPQPPGRGAGVVHESGMTEFRLEGLTLRVTALDSTLVSETKWVPFMVPFPVTERADPAPIPRLMLLFELHAATPEFGFDPMLLTLRTPEGGTLHPLAYVGPGEHQALGDSFKRTCAVARDAPAAAPHRRFQPRPALERRADAGYAPIPSTHQSCFVIAFDVVVTPPASVELSMGDALARAAQPIALPTLRFTRRAAKGPFLDVPPANLP